MIVASSTNWHLIAGHLLGILILWSALYLPLLAKTYACRRRWARYWLPALALLPILLVVYEQYGKQTIFESRWKRVEEGMSRSEVERILGKPDHTIQLDPMKHFVRDPICHFIYRSPYLNNSLKFKTHRPYINVEFSPKSLVYMIPHDLVYAPQETWMFHRLISFDHNQRVVDSFYLYEPSPMPEEP